MGTLEAWAQQCGLANRDSIFLRGYDVGYLHARLLGRPGWVEATCRVSSVGTIAEMAEAEGYYIATGAARESAPFGARVCKVLLTRRDG